MKGMKRITHIGGDHVVIRRRNFRTMVKRLGREASEFEEMLERCGRYYVATRDAWQVVLEDLSTVDGEGSLARARGGDCDDGCDDVCERDGGCDFTGGDPGECVYVCENGEVYLQNPAV